MYEIKVKIHEEADLYSSLDPDREQLDMEVKFTVQKTE